MIVDERMMIEQKWMSEVHDDAIVDDGKNDDT
jgi:hypothetical protein